MSTTTTTTTTSTTTTSTTGPPCGGACPPDDWRGIPDWVVGTLAPPACTTSTTTSTTTTRPPCPGNCLWTYDPPTRLWELTTDGCPDNGDCGCFAPTFCPPVGASPCTTTGCGHFGGNDLAPVVCDGSPPPPPPPECTTTTLPPAVVCGSGGCTLFCHPVYHYWVELAADCGDCPCDYNSLSMCGPGINECVTETVGCIVPGPPAPPLCTNSCRYVWVDDGINDPYWVFLPLQSGCAGFPPALPCGPCACDWPTDPGTVCGEEAAMPCYYHCNDVPCSPPPPPDGCNGKCRFRGVDGAWVFASGCPGCGCQEPTGPPSGLCDEYAETPCLPPAATTTTTTTTTTSTTTTSTTPAPGCGYCAWLHNGLGFALDQYFCTDGCGCPPPAATNGGDPWQEGDYVVLDCYDASVTTTTSTTTTSTTTTSTTTTSTTTTSTTTTCPPDEPCTLVCGWECQAPAGPGYSCGPNPDQPLPCTFCPPGVYPWAVGDFGCDGAALPPCQCGCAYPAVYGVRGATVVTACVPGGTTTTPPPGTTTTPPPGTTTTAPPASCSGTCEWECDPGGASWTRTSGPCVGAGCDCVAPPLPCFVSEVRTHTPCEAV